MAQTTESRIAELEHWIRNLEESIQLESDFLAELYLLTHSTEAKGHEAALAETCGVIASEQSKERRAVAEMKLELATLIEANKH